MLSSSDISSPSHLLMSWYLGHKHFAFYALIVTSVLCVFTGLAFDFTPLMLLPLIILIGLTIVAYPKSTFLSFFGILPFSIEVYFSNGLGTDLPTEPLILFFFLWGVFTFFSKKTSIQQVQYSPVLIFLIIHVFWILFSSLYSVFPLVSLKFFIAKMWYVIPFFFLGQLYLKDEKSIAKWIKIFLIGLAISIVYVFIRHLTKGLSFDSIGWAVSPFYRNHVNYAALITIAIPMCWYISRHSGFKWTFRLILLVLLIAIYFSFTRAAMVTVAIMIIAYCLLRMRLLFIACILGILVAIGTIFYFSIENRYLHLAPEYETTVAHDKFGNLMEATYELEDISTMERLHRWVAGFHMISERPLTGYGPNNFYFNYKPYTNYSFKTYVSNNVDKSGIHNYYLMTAVEQGLPGLIFLLAFIFSAIYCGEAFFHRCHDSINKDLVMMLVLMIIAIVTLNLINDLMEAVKVGPFLFIACGLIHRLYTNEEKIVKKPILQS